MADDKYGIPTGGNNGPWVAKKWAKINWVLTWEEIMASLALGGWPESLWPIAGATAAAESSRNPFIYNTYKRGHFGLFQISRSAHPEFFAPGGEGMAWVTPWENSREGYAIYKSQGWGAWEGKTSGAYLAYLGQATAAAAALKKKAGGKGSTAFYQKLYRDKTREYVFAAAVAGNSSSVTGGLGGAIGAGAEGTAGGVQAAGDATASTVGDMAQVVTGAWTALTNPAFWMRIAYGATGVVLVVGGLMLIVRNTPAGQKTASAVASVVPGGKLLKGAGK